MSLFELLVVTRWFYFAAVFVLFGAPLFWFYQGREASAPGPQGLPRSLFGTLLLLRIAVPVAVLSGVAWLAEILANMAEGFASVVDPATLHLFFFETQFGTVAILRLALLTAAAVIVALPWHNRAWLSALLHIGALLLISQAWLGHAAEGGAGLYGAFMIIAYSVHMFAAGAWVGGLPVLLWALFEVRHLDPDAAAARTLAILSRYSLMAIVAVTLIVASGIANAGFRVAGAFHKLFWTGYGDVLVAKVSVVALMLALAYFNRFVAMPRLRRTVLKDMTQIARLRASVGVELALGVLVLGVAAVLGITPPPQ
jgi:putative copper resistance protein D